MDTKKKDEKGFTLMEIIIGIAIMGIAAMIAVPEYLDYMDKSKAKVCGINCDKSRDLYDAYLIFENKVHSAEAFTQFVTETDGVICPDQGTVEYVSGKLICIKHGADKEDDSGAPIL